MMSVISKCSYKVSYQVHIVVIISLILTVNNYVYSNMYAVMAELVCYILFCVLSKSIKSLVTPLMDHNNKLIDKGLSYNKAK